MKSFGFVVSLVAIAALLLTGMAGTAASSSLATPAGSTSAAPQAGATASANPTSGNHAAGAAQPAGTPKTGETPQTANMPQTQGSVIRSTTSLVVIDVTVTQNGHPVKNVARPEFHVYENGKEQSIKFFEEHASQDAAAIEKSAEPAANTYSNIPFVTLGPPTALLLDALNTPMEGQAYVRDQMIGYLKNIPRGTHIAIFTLGTRLRLLQGFTTDSSALLDALQNKKNWQSKSALLTTRDEKENDENSAQDLADLIGGSDDGNLMIDRLRQFQADVAVARTDQRVQMTLEVMKQLAHYLGAFPGRKSLIWFSGSFPLSLDPDLTLFRAMSVERQYGPQVREVNDQLAAARVAVYPVDARGLMVNSTVPATNQGASIARGAGGVRSRAAASRGGIVDPFGDETASNMRQLVSEHETMDKIAEETGGAAFYNSNGIQQAIGSIMDAGANFYTIAYSPDEKSLDGKFRKIQVKLVDKNKELKYQLSYRRGYYANASGANNPDPNVNPEANSVAVALQHSAPPLTQLLFKVRVLPADDPATKNLPHDKGPAGLFAAKLNGPVRRYSLDYETDLRQVGGTVGDDGEQHPALELLAIAYDQGGRVINAADHVFKLKISTSAADSPSHGQLTLRQEIDLPPGSVYLRLGIHDLATNRLGAIEIPLKVTVGESK